ncbi:MAG: M14-type cytosolic carboxypeptidase [Pseudomonadota bacterium]
MEISDSFDAGNIQVLSLEDPKSIELHIRPDEGGSHYQWFYFRVTGARGIDLKMKIVNAAGASYAQGWENYQACVSYDRRIWHRARSTCYNDGVLTIESTPKLDVVWYAYFAPYSMEQHYDLISRSLRSPLVRHEVIGRTLDGQDIDLLRVTEAGSAPTECKKQCWIFARQHPGESMAEHLIDGLIDRLVKSSEPVSRLLLKKCDLWIVPNMNPDGSRRGHLRTNAVGTDLNREWQEPTMERSPEVYQVRRKMNATGLDFALDVHGDEGLPYNFIAGPEGVESVTEHHRALQAEFESELKAANPDFQTEFGYPPVKMGEADMSIATNWLADHFGALAMTLEMPFKDNANMPDSEFGWSPSRCGRLGEAVLTALLQVVDRIE